MVCLEKLPAESVFGKQKNCLPQLKIIYLWLLGLKRPVFLRQAVFVTLSLDSILTKKVLWDGEVPAILKKQKESDLIKRLKVKGWHSWKSTFIYNNN